jgi:hypothetical protein
MKDCPANEKQKAIWRKASNKYSSTHRKQSRKCSKEYYYTHKETRRKLQRDYTFKYRNRILELLGKKCANPYNLNHGDFLEDSRCLQIDHVKGGGTKELKSGLNRWSYYKMVYKKILEGSKDYQLLCANCNWIKRHEKREWRNQYERLPKL